MTPETYVARQDGTHGRYRMCRNRSGTQAGSRPIAGHQELGSGGSGQEGMGWRENKIKSKYQRAAGTTFLGKEATNHDDSVLRQKRLSPCHLVDFSRLYFNFLRLI